MEIRNTQLSDSDTVYALLCELEAKELDKEAVTRLYRQGLEDPTVHYLLAEEPGTETVHLGFMSLQVRPFLHRAGTVTEVMELIVRAHIRSWGVGQRLFDRALEIARNNGSVQLELCSNVLRTRTHQFYERNGMNRDQPQAARAHRPKSAVGISRGG